MPRYSLGILQLSQIDCKALCYKANKCNYNKDKETEKYGKFQDSLDLIGYEQEKPKLLTATRPLAKN